MKESTSHSILPPQESAFVKRLLVAIGFTILLQGAAAQNAPPVITVNGVRSGPPAQVEIKIHDNDDGLNAIAVPQYSNADVPVPPFTVGTMDPVIVTATKINQTQPIVVTFVATDVAGNSTTFTYSDQISGTISGNQTICLGNTATLTFTAIGTGTSGTITYKDFYNGAQAGTYTVSCLLTGSAFTATVNGLAAGTHTFTIVSVQDDDTTANTGSGSAIVTVNAPSGSPADFGSNVWNVYAWNAGGAIFTNNADCWNTNYAGYYTDNSLDINTESNWGQNTSPSSAAGYAGCTVQVDNMSFSAKRQGFPCGYYQLDIPGHDDGAQLWINGTMVWSEDGYNPNTITNVWTGWLGANDKVELKVTDGSGGSFGKLHFAVRPGNNGDPTVFGNNTWNVYAWNAGGSNFTNNADCWNTNYAGYYSDNNLDVNTENNWDQLTSPSFATGYTGCAVQVDNMSYSAKRQGFPCGYYQLDVPGHDDGAQLWINGTKVWSEDGYNPNTVTNVWAGWLGANDKAELKVTDGAGGTFGKLVFNKATGSVVYVDSSKVVGGNGTSWANAFKYLQDALTAAQTNSCINQIWVAKGTYYPDEGSGKFNNDRNASFVMKNDLSIYGGFAGNETVLSSRNWQTNPTILSGDIDQNDGDNFANNGGNSFHVIFNNNGLNSTAVLDGFTLKGGNSTFAGGGMYNNNASSPTLANCIFTVNIAIQGGGMYNQGSSPTLTNCSFNGNKGTSGGGGMHNVSSSPTLLNCSFSGNKGSDGGGMYNNNASSPMLTNCSFSGNNATSQGGGMFNQSSSAPTLTNCSFSGNTAFFGGGVNNVSLSSTSTFTNCNFSANGANFGGGMYNNSSAPILINCSFAANNASSQGGGMHNNSSSSILTNCTFAANNASQLGGGIFNNASSPTLTNCIIWGNTANSNGSIYNINSSPGITYSLIEGASGGTGNLDGTIASNNPLFQQMPAVSPFTAGNLRLQATSPVINKGSNIADLDGTGTGTATIADIANDLDGNARIQLGTVDMGAYESSCQAQGDPTVFGNNQWNVYGYNSGNGTLAGTDWSSNYVGYYTSSTFNFNTDNDWNNLLSPSSASNYQGCSVQVDAFTFIAKRQGFPCGYYSLNLYHDDASQLYINGNKVWEGDSWGNAGTVWSGWLGANDKVELRVTDGSGGSGGQLQFTKLGDSILYVNAAATAVGDGGSWGTAYTYLQDALTAANNNSCVKQIWVAKGTYYPDEGTGKTNDDRTASFAMKNNLAIYGGFAGGETQLSARNWSTNPTILSGDIDQNDGTTGNGANSYHVVANGNAINNTAMLDGFVITGGKANGDFSANFGGGVLNDGRGGICNPTFLNCTFRLNEAGSGGAVANLGDGGNSSTSFINCVFFNNKALLFGGPTRGGACYLEATGAPVFTNCTFANNQSAARGGALLLSSNSGAPHATLTNCILWGNTATAGGTQITNINSTTNISYSILQGGFAAINNFSGINNDNGSNSTADPLFVDAANGNLRLQTCSPAVNAGDNSADTLSTDLDGNPRKVGTIDMGAYENQQPDSIPPVITSPPLIVRATAPEGSCQATVVLPTPVATDNCSVRSIVSDHPLSTYGLGVTKVYWTATDAAGNTSLDSQFVSVTPTLAIIRVNANANSCNATNVSLGGFLSNCSGYTISNDHASTTYPIGVTKVNWTVNTPAGKTLTYVQQVVVYDNQAPSFRTVDIVRRNADVGSCSTNITLTPPAASDNCGTPQVTNDHPSTQFNVGWTTVKWTATDASGNKKSILQPVVVYDVQPPVFVMPPVMRRTANASTCNATIVLDTPSVSDNCGMKKITKNYSSTIFPIGWTYVTWTAEDNYGNKKTAVQSVVVYPVAGCSSASVVAARQTHEHGEAIEGSAGIYPNPTTGSFTVALENLRSSKAEVSTISANGKTVYRQAAELMQGKQTLHFNIGANPPGVYLVKVVSDEGVRTLKVVLE